MNNFVQDTINSWEQNLKIVHVEGLENDCEDQGNLLLIF